MSWDAISTGLALVSAVLWFLSARVSIPTGWDNDLAMTKGFKRAAAFNSAGAGAAALAALAQALKPWLPLM